MTRSSLKLLNWPFRLKLLVAPGLALAAMALLAVLGASRLSEQSAAVSRVANAQAQTGALAAASQGIQDINGRIYKLLAQQAAHTEGLNAAAALRALNPQIDAVGQTLASYRDSYATPQTLPVVNALIADVQKYKGAVGVVSQMLDVDFGAAVSFLAPFDANFESLNRRLKSLADGVAQSAAIEARHSAQAAADSRSFFLALTAGVLLAVGAIGLMISEPTIASIKTIATTTMALAEGNSFIDLASLARNDELGSIVRSLAIFAQNQRRIASLQSEAAALQQSALAEQQAALEVRAQTERQQLLVVGALAKGLSSLASGDLGARLQTHFNPEYEQLRTDFNSAAGSLEEALGTIAEAAETVQQNAEEIARASEDLARRTEHQAANLQQTATALDQITGAVGKSASGAAEVAALVTTTRADADAAGQVVREAMGAMQAIEGSSSQIGQIIGMIDEIAFQTNLLALNAGVEAARAGDAGRGFAVVAQEVRALAQRATGAAREIKTLISTSSREVGSGVALVGKTGQGLQRIVDQVAAIDRLVQGISAASGDQARGLTEVNGATGHMDQAVQQNAAMVEQVSASAHVLNGEVGKLRALLGTFKVSVPRMSAPAISAPAISAPGTPSRAARTRAAAFV